MDRQFSSSIDGDRGTLSSALISRLSHEFVLPSISLQWAGKIAYSLHRVRTCLYVGRGGCLSTHLPFFYFLVLFSVVFESGLQLFPLRSCYSQ